PTLPPIAGIESAERPSIKGEFFNKIRRFCGKTPVRGRRISTPEHGTSAFVVRRFAVAAVQEISWPVS
ncbi:hypothetical protein, partial [Tropicibacter alexandrii]|uniref:hypothetical protein n=1 Tax=Tropicibacter alexandrii TaxID=2267683 RepID=UPI00197EF970